MDRIRLSAITWILAAVSGLLGLGTPAAAQVPAAERAALIAVYNAANGPEWATRTNWRDAGDTDFGAAGTECTWYGVTCTGGTVTQLSLQANQLRGTLPPALLDLTGLSDGASDLRWNAVHTSDATLLAFLNSKQVGGDWQSTQTVAVTGLALPSGRPAPTSIPLSWTPIAYTGDGGGYRISTSTTPGGPYTTWGTTAAKTDTSVTVTGLTENTTYYFVIESVTNAHANNANTVLSERSAEITAKTPDFGFYGWATENGGTTGGAGGTEVVVNNLADFKLYANAPGAYIIYIYGTISGNEMVRVGSNKSILGVGSNARFLGVGLTIGWSTAVPKISNVIVRNITFEKIIYPNDAITVGYSTKNVWIDHCDFFSDRLHGVDGYDGLVDVNHGSDFITVSWNRFYEHYKTSLVGNSEDTGAEDFGHLTVTYHHNSFINSGGRNPSVRFGTVHIFNNHYRDLDDYAIASRQSAQVVIENNWFENVTRPIRADTSLSPVAGYVRGVESNTFINCGANSITLGPATWVPPYAYTLDPVTNLPTYTGWWAGVGIVTWNAASPPNPLTLTSGGGGTVAADPTPGPYAPGTVVTLTATPDTDYYFTNWSGDLTGSTNPTSITMDTPKSVTAHFAPIVTGLSLTVTTVGSGSVTRIPDLSSYVSGTVVTLTAVPVAGGSFVGWGGDCSGTALTCELTMDVAKSVTATFTVVASAVYLHDVFVDGERVTQTLPDSAKWMTSSGSSNLTVVSNELTQVASSSRTLLAYFTDDQSSPVTLSAGQILKLDYVFRFTGFDSAASASTFTFRSGLLRSVANPAATTTGDSGFVATGPPNTNARVTDDFSSSNPSSGVFSLYTGYAAFAAVNAAGTATPVRLYTRNGSSPNLLNSTSSPPFTEVTGGTPTASTAMAVDTPYRGTLMLRHTGSSIVMSYVITRVSDGAVMMSRSVTDGGASMTNFDTAAFYVTKASGSATYSLIFSDVQVSRSATFDLTATTAGTGSGSVTSSPAGIDCGVDCSETFEQGTVVTLTATPVAGSVFTGWSGDCSGSSVTCNVTMDGARSVTAGFAPAFTLTVATAGTGSGTVTGTGIDCGLDCTEPYADGSVVTLTAAPAVGSVFTGWSGGCTGATLTCDVTMDAARSVTATFAVAYTLTVATDGEGTGTVTAAGIDCGVDCSEDYAAGSIVTLTATSDPGSTFAAWSGDCAGATVTCDVTMDAARSVTATFALQPSTIFLHDTWADANRTNQGLPDSAAWFASSGSSSITTTVGEMNQAVSSARTLLAYFTNDQGTPVTLGTGQVLRLDFTFRLTNFDTAAAATASTFRVGLLRSVANPAAVTGTGFVPTTPPPNTNARVTGDYGSGSPSSNVFSIYTGYAALTSANAVGTAIPVKFYARNLSDAGLIASTTAYTKFSDGTTTPSVPMAADTAYHGTLSLVRTDSGIAMSYVLVQASDGAVVMSHSVTDPAASMTAFDTAAFYVSKAGSSANYNLIFTDVQVSRGTAHTLTAATAGTGSGTVTAPGINCGVDCSEGYEQGAVVTLTATPATGSTFTGWSGDCSGTTPTCDVTMNGPRGATASFTLNTYALSVTKDGTGTGSVASSPTGIDCGLDCTETYDYGSVVLLTAIPAAESSLAAWSGACTGASTTCQVTIDAAKSVNATFSLNTYALAVTKDGTGTGGVASLPMGIDCGNDCGEAYNYGTVVTLTATPSAGSTFTGWSGACTGASITCQVTIDGAKSVNATFTLDTYALTVTKDGTGAGGVASLPVGIDCGIDCSETYDYGTVVTLTATPASGSAFSAWGGDCSGTSPTCQVEIRGTRSVSASFERLIPSVSVADITVGRSSIGTATATFPVTLSLAPIETVTVSYATSDGTATAGIDYVATSGTLSFAPGETSKSVAVTVNGRPGVSAATFFLDLSDPVNATIGDAQGQASLTFVSQDLFTVTPCRILDTRDPSFAEPALSAGSSREFKVTEHCDVPTTAKAVSVNVTVTGSTAPGDLRLYPAGSDLPLVSTINYSAGQTRANNAVVVVGSDGKIGVHSDQPSGTVNFILDVNGYFE